MRERITYRGNGQIRVVVSSVDEHEPRLFTIRKNTDVYRGDIPDAIFDGFKNRDSFEGEPEEDLDYGNQ